ncbi:MAG: SpoIIE family protein phosphatase [Phycisphaerae bacterium]|jgi:sigma-B regulation protein RsbU (phosphoserine phosphatase)|nr:SpoIIE family protein phosphatase [Phycisphaerae bacterium]
MTIGFKRQALLLSIALIPMVGIALIYRQSMSALGKRQAAEMKETLRQEACRQLRTLVYDYGRIINRDQRALERAVETQATAVQARLAKAPPPAPRILYSSDYDSGAKGLPGDMAISKKHLRLGADGKRHPVAVTYSDQVYFLARGADKQVAGGDMARLSTMPEVYRRVYDANPSLMYWQYTSLESGFHTSWPGHGGYPEDYDPRKREWYIGAKTTGELEWYLMSDVSTGTVTLCAAMPVRKPDGSFAGVTAIDVPLRSVLDLLILPEAWRPNAETMLVHPGPAEAGLQDKLMILVQKSYRQRKDHWKKLLKLPSLESPDTDELAALTADIDAGRSGVRRMIYKGRDSLWAYGERKDTHKQAAALVIVPYDQVIAQGRSAEQHALGQMKGYLQLAGMIMFAVLVVVIAVAFRSARKLTGPVLALSDAAKDLAEGDFDASVEIKTGDELENLGNIFNEMGPKLREREKMKRSLEMAMEIQQHLLPQGSPPVDGFDIAGKSIYCDETGGDYYDFIELAELGAGRLGIALGDVSGHGIGAALLMAAARGVLRSHAASHGANLGELFETLNRHLVRDTGEEQFMTLFYAVLDAETKSLVWTSGGHDPALWLQSAGGEIQELPNTGIPLGILDDAQYEQAGPIELESGDIVLVGTDGIWEARNTAGEMFGKDRLRKILSDSTDRSAAEIHDMTVETVRDFRQAHPQEDDVTLVVIKAL